MWSEINREKANKLVVDGKMKPSGLAEIERAKADGRWDRAYAPPSTAVVPADLEAAFAKNARAKKTFDGLSRANRYAILFRVQNAKKEETRMRRIEELVAMLARGETIH